MLPTRRRIARHRVAVTLLATVVPIATALVFTPFAVRIVDPTHDGFMLKTALDVMDGRRLFRDTFSQYGALTPWMHAGVLVMFGPTLAALKLWTVALYAITAALLFGTWSRLMPLGLALLGWLIWLALPPFYEARLAMLAWPSVTALVFQALGLFSLARLGYASSAPRWAAVAGVSAVLAQWARTPVGLLHLAATAMALVLLAAASRSGGRLRREGAAFVVGVVLTELIFFGILAAQGSVVDWWTQTVLWPAQWVTHRARSLREVFACLLPVARLEVRGGTGTRPDTGALVALIVAVSALPAARALRAPRWRWLALAAAEGILVPIVLMRDSVLVEAPLAWALLVPLITLGVAVMGAAVAVRGTAPGPTLAGIGVVLPALSAWQQYVPVADYRHLFWGMSPALGICLYALYVLAGRRSLPVALLVLLLVGPLWHSRWQQARAKLAEPMRPIRGVPLLAGMRDLDSHSTELERLAHTIQDWNVGHPGTAIVLMGRQGLVAALAPDRSNYWPIYLPREAFPVTTEETVARERFIAARRPLIWVDFVTPDEFEAILTRYGYRPLTEPDLYKGTLLAPIEPLA